jgi:hypothetical protein
MMLILQMNTYFNFASISTWTCTKKKGQNYQSNKMSRKSMRARACTCHTQIQNPSITLKVASHSRYNSYFLSNELTNSVRPQVVQPLDSFTAFYGTRRLITAFTRALQLHLSWARPIQSTTLNPISKMYILMLSLHLGLGLPSGLFPSGFPTITYTRSSSPPFVLIPYQEQTPWSFVHKRTLPSERAPLVDEI